MVQEGSVVAAHQSMMRHSNASSSFAGQTWHNLPPYYGLVKVWPHLEHVNSLVLVLKLPPQIEQRRARIVSTVGTTAIRAHRINTGGKSQPGIARIPSGLKKSSAVMPSMAIAEQKLTRRETLKRRRQSASARAGSFGIAVIDFPSRRFDPGSG